MPRRLSPPDPPLADDIVRLDPLHQGHVAAFEPLVDDDDVRRYTMVPTRPNPRFLAHWVRRYEQGWRDGSRAGFAMTIEDEQTAGFAAIFGLDEQSDEGEIGYFVGASARGRSLAARSVTLLTGWGFGELGLQRLELRIDTGNAASERVAERCGYRREGVLRDKYFKEGRRTDVGIWSRLPSDPAIA